jgi:outer membrane receptor protein involved in Fe transport
MRFFYKMFQSACQPSLPTCFIIVIMAFSSAESVAMTLANGVIKGSVVESVSTQPLDYVNVVIYPKGDERMLTGGISAMDGSFRIDDIPFGEYDVHFTFIGFEKHVMEGIRVNRGSPEADLGVVQISPGSEMMDAVTVTADRDMLLFNLDKTIFSVDRDMTATGGSALDIMESIPSVAVDADGRINLRGSSNVTILVDGRPSYLESIDQIPATMIDRVEVITNPSARYDPDGTSGIINIIMKRQRQHGTNGMLSLNMGTGDKYNGSVHLNHRVDRLNLFGNYDFRVHGMEGFNINDRNRITTDGDTLRQLHQHEDFFRTGYFNNFRLGADLVINPNNTLMVSAAFNLRDTRPRNYSEVNLFLPADYDLHTSMERRFEGFGREYVLNYKRTFDQPGQELMFDAFVAASSGDTYRDVSVEATRADVGNELYFLEASAPGIVISLQTDYVHPLNERGRFEVGVKSIFRELEDDFKFFDVDMGTGEQTLNLDYTNYFVYNEAIHSAYGIMGYALGALHLQAGLRAELHHVDALQKATNDGFDRSLFNVFPSVHAKYFASDVNSWFLSYGKRVNRPGVALLNPFVNYSDPMNISFGNPELQPEYIHSYEFGYQYSQNRKSLGATLFYRQTDDIISREMTLFGGDNPQTHTTFNNLQSGISYGIEAVANYPLASWWRFSGSASYFFVELKDDRLPDWDNSGDSWMLQASSTWTIWKKLELQSRFHYRSAEVTAGRTTGGGCQQHGGQGVQDAMYYLDLGLRANVLNGNGSISLRLNDVFKSRGFDMFTYGESFTSDLSRRTESRVVFLGFTYRFNEYRQRSERDREGSLLDELD